MKSTLWILILFVPFYALAQAVSPTPGITPVPLPIPSDSPSLIPTITGLISFARGWQSLGLYVAIATALKYLVDLSKLSFLGAPFQRIPEKYRLLVVTGIGTVIATLGFLAAGAPLFMAASAALGSAVGSSFVHELINDFSPGDAQPKPPAPQASA